MLSRKIPLDQGGWCKEDTEGCAETATKFPPEEDAHAETADDGALRARQSRRDPVPVPHHGSG